MIHIRNPFCACDKSMSRLHFFYCGTHLTYRYSVALGSQGQLPELVVLTAASAKLVAGVFIRAGQSNQKMRRNDDSLGFLSPFSRKNVIFCMT